MIMIVNLFYKQTHYLLLIFKCELILYILVPGSQLYEYSVTLCIIENNLSWFLCEVWYCILEVF